MPDDLKARLETFAPKPAAAKVKTLSELPAAYDLPWFRWNSKTRTEERGTEEIPLAVHQTELTAQRELPSVLRLIDFGKVTVSDKTRRPSVATIKAITNVLEGGDYYPVLPVKSKWHDENAAPIRAFAWPLIVQARGLAQLSGSKLQLTTAGRKALSQPAAETLHRLWFKWIDTTIIDELSRIECVKGQTGKGKRGLTALSSRRDAIANTLAECPAGSWIATDEFRRFVCASGNDYVVSRNAWDLYIGEKHYGSLGYEGGEQILDERYLLAFLLEYAATLGVIDVALIPPAGARYNYGGLWGTDEFVYFSRYDGLMYFRITALGAYCLGADTEYQPAPWKRGRCSACSPTSRSPPSAPSSTKATASLSTRTQLKSLISSGVWTKPSCLLQSRKAGKYLADRIDDTSFRVDPGYRGVLKQALVSAGYPAEDLAGYLSGDALDLSLRDRTISGTPFSVREYQRQAAEPFYASGSARGGSGVIVLPCGAGKTIVGLAAMQMVSQTALVLTTSLTSVKQWRREICDKTSLLPDEIAEYTGEQKSTGPVTLTTYQILTWRSRERFSTPRAVSGATLGPHHLRRGPSAARAGVSRDRRPTGATSTGPYRHTGPRKQPRRRSVRAHRSKTVRCALARSLTSKLDSQRQVCGRTDANDPGAAHEVCPRKQAGPVSYRRREPGQDGPFAPTARTTRRGSRPRHRGVHRAGRGHRQRDRRAPGHRKDPAGRARTDL